MLSMRKPCLAPLKFLNNLICRLVLPLFCRIELHMHRTKLINSLIPLALLAAVALPLGCTGKALPTIVKAEGIVTLDGTPVENATITFISEKTDYHAIGNTDAQGNRLPPACSLHGR